jgi:hypothetical protein
MQLFSLAADASVNECRAAGGRKGCVLSLVVSGASAGDPAAAA